jgi:hypothetical protein
MGHTTTNQVRKHTKDTDRKINWKQFAVFLNDVTLPGPA